MKFKPILVEEERFVSYNKITTRTDSPKSVRSHCVFTFLMASLICCFAVQLFLADVEVVP